jgi:hypothetical protein
VLEAVFEFLAQIVVEILWQILLEVLTSLGWESLDHSVRRERRAHPVLAGIGHLLLGLTAGVVSLFVLPQRLTPRSPLPGVSLVLSPIVTGIFMDRIGEWWRERGHDRPKLFSFWAGAIFAFGMALVRFLYLEREWRPF